MECCTDFDLVDWQNPLTDNSLNDRYVALWLPGSPGFRSQVVRDICGKQNHGSGANDLGWSAGKKIGPASLSQDDADQYVSLPVLGNFQGSGTYAAWMWGTDWSQWRSSSGYKSRNHDLGVEAGFNGGKIIASFWDNTAGTFKSVKSAVAAPNEEWFFAVAAFSAGGNLSLFVNGELEASTSYGSAEPQTFGHRLLYYSDPVSGQVDWLGPYRQGPTFVKDVEMTADEIREWYNESLLGFPGILRRHSTRTYFAPLGGGVTITPASCTHAHAADSPAITQTHVVAVNDADHSQTTDSPTITQTHTVVAADADHSHDADSPTVTQSHVVAAADADHSHAADSPAITQTHVIVAADADHAQTADNVTVTVNAVSIVAADADHAQTSDSPTITQTHIVAAADADHVHTADNTTVTQTHSVIVADATHSHAVDNVTVTVAGVSIDVNDADHGQTVDSPGITQTHVITVSGTIHTHLVDNVTVSISEIITGPAGIEFTTTGRPADFTLDVSLLDYTTTGRPADFTLDSE